MLAVGGHYHLLIPGQGFRGQYLSQIGLRLGMQVNFRLLNHHRRAPFRRYQLPEQHYQGIGAKAFGNDVDGAYFGQRLHFHRFRRDSIGPQTSSRYFLEQMGYSLSFIRGIAQISGDLRFLLGNPFHQGNIFYRIVPKLVFRIGETPNSWYYSQVFECHKRDYDRRVGFVCLHQKNLVALGKISGTLVPMFLPEKGTSTPKGYFRLVLSEGGGQ